jgi:dipeptidyl aminopeptidase/acylaminoacyl peptidase
LPAWEIGCQLNLKNNGVYGVHSARGYAVLYPNVRDSTGYGNKLVEMNRGHWGGGDFKDVMAGVDAVINRGIADPAKLGIGGWSYGGYMARGP